MVEGHHTPERNLGTMDKDSNPFFEELAGIVQEIAIENDCTLQEAASALTDAYLLDVKFRALTKREMEIAILTAQGFSIKETAQKLTISPSTVQSHRKRIRGKLEVARYAPLKDNLPKSFYKDGD